MLSREPVTLAMLLGILAARQLTSCVGVYKLYSEVQVHKRFAIYCKTVLGRDCESLHTGLLPREKCHAEANPSLA